MGRLSRRAFVYLGASATARLMHGGEPGVAQGVGNHPPEAHSANVQQHLLELAARQEAGRRAAFAAVKSPAELAKLQRSLREKFLGLIGGLPESHGAPLVRITGQIEAEDYSIEKLVFESFPATSYPRCSTGPSRLPRRSSFEMTLDRRRKRRPGLSLLPLGPDNFQPLGCCVFGMILAESRLGW